MDSRRLLGRREALGAAMAGTAALALGDMNAEKIASEPVLRRCSPTELGVSPTAILAFIDAVEARVGGLHGFMLLRKGDVAAEGWWAPYAPTYPHMLFSLSKSFTSTAVGLAVAEGRITVDDRVLSFFPDQAPAKPGRNLEAMRVRHLLTMTTGHTEDTLGRTTRATEGDWVRTFLSLPVEHEPGQPFVYNSGATYMLSAIVQKVTGKPLLDYLRPRLFAPLGIRGMTWQTCPKGINTGGWGLSVKTEDIARFGLLYLRNGVWNGRRIIPEDWVRAATSKQVSNGTDPISDWAQGYGYQFWRCRHGAYRGDGAFGQYCIVMPQQDAVLAITSGVGDMQAVLNCVWEHLLPGMGGNPTPRSAAALTERLRRLEVRPPAGASSASYAKAAHGRIYSIEPNEEKIRSIGFAFRAGRCTVTVIDESGEHRIVCGMSDWASGVSTLGGGPKAKVAFRGAWASDDTLVLKGCYTESPFEQTITCRFENDQLTWSSRINVSFGPTEGPTLKGKAIRSTSSGKSM